MLLLPLLFYIRFAVYSAVDHTDIDGDASGQYLRRCESSWAIGEAIRREGVLHGVKVYSGTDSVCDYDGSFWNKRREKSNEYCVPKTGQYGGSGGNHQQLGARPMNCQCFRDAILYSEEGRTMSMLCDRDHATGNYHVTSPTNSTSTAYRCVDKDGFFYGDTVDSKKRCCLENKCCSPSGTCTMTCEKSPGVPYQICELLKM